VDATAGPVHVLTDEDAPTTIGTLPPVDNGDLAIRNLTYQQFVNQGRAPTSAEVAATAGVDVSTIRAAWQRLHDAHAVVLDTASGEIRMANPFSAVPTPYRVHAGGRWWYANCAWDAFGICAALDSDGRIETACADCADQLRCDVRDRRPSPDTLVFHCFVPAAAWWDDIVFT